MVYDHKIEAYLVVLSLCYIALLKCTCDEHGCYEIIILVRMRIITMTFGLQSF